MLEKINDNAYKLELPADFGVSPTFNIADLKPYLGEDDEHSKQSMIMHLSGSHVRGNIYFTNKE